MIRRRYLPSGIPISFILLASICASAQQPIPVRPLGPVVARSIVNFGNPSSLAVRPLPNGAVLLNDQFERRLLLLDSSLAISAVILDSVRGARNGYGGLNRGTLMRYLGDSSLFVSLTLGSALVIDPSGAVTRAMLLPRSATLSYVIDDKTSTDAQGRLVYQAAPQDTFAQALVPLDRSQPLLVPRGWMLLLRTDWHTNRIDTVAHVALQTVYPMTEESGPNGPMTNYISPMPLRPGDDWSVMSDGSIAVVRGQDYHVDWIDSTNATTSSPPVAHEWHRLTDQDKATLMDSVRRKGAELQQFEASDPSPGRAMIYSTVAPSELPDYAPPFNANAAKSDPAGNLWVQVGPRAGLAEGPIYEILNRNGQLVDRVELPAAYRTLIGFGADGTVFLASNLGSLARVRFR